MSLRGDYSPIKNRPRLYSNSKVEELIKPKESVRNPYNLLNLSNLLDKISKKNLNAFYTNKNASFKKRIDELNQKFFHESENFLKNKTKYDIQKSQEKLLIILIEQINCYLKEIEILNKTLIDEKNKNTNKEFDTNINSRRSSITNNMFDKLSEDLNKRLSIKIKEFDKLKVENDSLKRRNKFLQEMLSKEVNIKKEKEKEITKVKEKLHLKTFYKGKSKSKILEKNNSRNSVNFTTQNNSLRNNYDLNSAKKCSTNNDKKKFNSFLLENSHSGLHDSNIMFDSQNDNSLLNTSYLLDGEFSGVQEFNFNPQENSLKFDVKKERTNIKENTNKNKNEKNLLLNNTIEKAKITDFELKRENNFKVNYKLSDEKNKYLEKKENKSSSSNNINKEREKSAKKTESIYTIKNFPTNKKILSAQKDTKNIKRKSNLSLNKIEIIPFQNSFLNRNNEAKKIKKCDSVKKKILDSSFENKVNDNILRKKNIKIKILPTKPPLQSKNTLQDFSNLATHKENKNEISNKSFENFANDYTEYLNEELNDIKELENILFLLKENELNNLTV